MGAATAGVDTRADVAVLTTVTAVVETALGGAGGVASVGAEMEEAGSGIGAGVAKGDASVSAVGVDVVAVVAESPGDSRTIGGMVLSTVGLEIGSFSGGGVGSKGCAEAFGSSEESEDVASRLLKDVGRAEGVEPDWGTEKAGLVFDSGGLNKLPDVAPLDKSAPVESSADF